jgi:hypothetical protein
MSLWKLELNGNVEPTTFSKLDPGGASHQLPRNRHLIPFADFIRIRSADEEAALETQTSDEQSHST